MDHVVLVIPRRFRPPISVVLFVCGSTIGALINQVADQPDKGSKSFDTLLEGLKGAARFNPHAVFYILLPPLLYESSSNMSWHVLHKVLPSAAILAVPGVAVNITLTAFILRFAGHMSPAEYDMTWPASLLLASILSATDPVAVVSALHALGAPKKFSTLIEGESLLNDGSAVVFFFVFLDMLAEDAPDSAKQCPAALGSLSYNFCVFAYFIKLAVGGTCLGVAVGFIVRFWIHWARRLHEARLEIGIVLGTIYSTFFFAEVIHVSGVLAVVFLGVTMTARVNSLFTNSGRRALDHVVEQIAYACNQLVFIAGGMISARLILQDSWPWYTWVELLGLYIAIHITRAVVVLVFSQPLQHLGYGVTWKEAIILVYGGLRGAVGLAMGLIVEHNEYVDPKIASMVAFHTSGIVILTLLINGSTVERLYKTLHLYQENDFRMNHLRTTLSRVELACREDWIKKIKKDWFFSDIHIWKILPCIPNFEQIEFDVAGLPHPAGIVHVNTCLRRLERVACQIAYSRASYKEVLLDRWASRKLGGGHKRISELSEDSPQQLEDTVGVLQKDYMLNVKNTGDRVLEYHELDASGHYISVQPLSVLVPGESQDFGYAGKVVHKGGDPKIIIGLVALTNDLSRSFSNQCHRALERPMGTMENTIGFDCESRSIICSGPLGTVKEPTHITYIGEGDIICVRATWSTERMCTVSFALDDGVAPLELIGSCAFGEFTAHEIHPLIEFGAAHERQRRTHDLSGWTQDLPIPRHSDRSNESARSQAPHDKTALGRYGSRPLAALRFLGRARGPAEAKLLLSFEPRNASDTERVTKMFHIIFNSVSAVYKDMHEHYILGHQALAIVTEATNEALDCANHERNSRNVRQFGMLPTELADSVSMNQQLLFEPIIIEYSIIEQYCTRTSFWDRLALKCGSLRQYAYTHTRANIEAIWAFVQAHEKVIGATPMLQQFPELLVRVRAVVAEAKGDLQTMRELYPRRFFYCKHFLALRVIMNSRLDQLRKFMKEGWITEEDGKALVEALQDRVVEVDHFFPKLQSLIALTGWTTVGQQNESLASRDAEDHADAWEVERSAASGGASENCDLASGQVASEDAWTGLSSLSNDQKSHGIFAASLAWAAERSPAVRLLSKSFPSLRSSLVTRDSREARGSLGSRRSTGTGLRHCSSNRGSLQSATIPPGLVLDDHGENVRETVTSSPACCHVWSTELREVASQGGDASSAKPLDIEAQNP